MSDSLRALLDSTPLGAGNAPYIESLYEQFLADPGSVEPKWRDYFSGLARRRAYRHGAWSDSRRAGAARARQQRPRCSGAPRQSPPMPRRSRARSRGSCRCIANRGHLLADIDPLGLMQPPGARGARARLLRPGRGGSRHGVLYRQPRRRDSEAHEAARHHRAAASHLLRHRSAPSSRTSRTRPSACGCRTASRKAACSIASPPKSARRSCGISPPPKASSATSRTKYPAQKRFSLEGGDALIPLLDDLIQQGGQRGVEEMVIGMAHRGRLNVLVNVVGKSPQVLFSEFEGKLRHEPHAGLGRREVSQGLLDRHPHARRQRARGARVQSFAPGSRQPGGRRLGARAPAAPRRRARATRSCRS